MQVRAEKGLLTEEEKAKLEVGGESEENGCSIM